MLLKRSFCCRELHFSVSTNKPAKVQALQAFRQLKASAVLPVVRAQMLLRLCFPSASRAELLMALSEMSRSSEEEGDAGLTLLEGESRQRGARLAQLVRSGWMQSAC